MVQVLGNTHGRIPNVMALSVANVREVITGRVELNWILKVRSDWGG